MHLVMLWELKTAKLLIRMFQNNMINKTAFSRLLARVEISVPIPGLDNWLIKNPNSTVCFSRRVTLQRITRCKKEHVTGENDQDALEHLESVV